MSEVDIIKALQEKISSTIRVAMPGVVEKYDFKTRKADIKIDMQELYEGGTSLDYPVIPSVPVIFPICGGASITMPIIRGDSCLVLFMDRDITRWMLGGSRQKPESRRTHHLSDAVAIMGLLPFTKPSAATNNTDVLINYDGSKIVLKPKGNVDIHSAKEINIKTEGVVINCKSAIVKAEESIAAECKTASIKSSENTSVECKNASVKASENVNIDCKNASVKAIENASTDCKNAIVKAAENVDIECKTSTIKASETASIDCKTSSVKASDSASIECVKASIKASGAINTESPNFTQKGNMKIDGNVEVTGTSKLTGKVDSDATITGQAIKTAGGIDLANHTHLYNNVTSVVTPPQGGAGVITKVPTNSSAAK